MFSSSFESSNLSNPTEIQMNISLLAHIAADSELQGRYGVQGYVFANTIGYFKSYLARLPEAHLSLKKLTESVEKLHGYARYIQDMAQRRASIKEATEFSGEIANRITALRSGEELILPGGWSNQGSPGHAMIYHFRKEGDVLRFYIYNAGAGVEYHEKMSSTSSERYFSTKVYEFKEVAHLQLMHLIRRLVVARLNHLHPDFDSKALYVHNIDEIIPFINDLTKDEPLLAQDLFEEVLTTTGQISGTCTQRSIHQMLKHYFKSLEDYRRFIVDFKIYAINDYLKQHPRCSQSIQELVSYAIINTIKICDTPELYAFDEKEAKLLQLYGLQSRLAQLPLQEKVMTEPPFFNNFAFQQYNSDISSPMFKLGTLFHRRQPTRVLREIVPSSDTPLLQELSDIYNTCQQAEASGDAIWVLKQIEQVFLDLPIPQSFKEPSIYDLVSSEELFEPFIQKLYDFQMLFNRCREAAFGKNQFVAEATVQMSIMAINDVCHRKYIKINGKPDFSRFFAYIIEAYFKAYTYSPYLASHHPKLDERFQALSSLYANAEKPYDTHSACLSYYHDLIKFFPEFHQELERRYEQQKPENKKFCDAILRAKAEALYVLCNQFDEKSFEMKLKPKSFLNDPIYAPLCTELRKQWEYECSILRGINSLFPRTTYPLNFLLSIEFNQISSSLEFHETFLKSTRNIRYYSTFPSEITRHQYEVKRTEMIAICHHENPKSLFDEPRKKTSNNIQISPYDRPTTRVINKEDFFLRDLLHLRTSQKHQASLTLDYFHEARDYLKDPEIQRYVEGNIFEPRVLSVTLKKDATFLIRFDEFIHAGLKAFVAVNKEMTHEALFFIRLSTYVNRFVAEERPGLMNRLENDYARVCDLILSNTDNHILASLHQYRFILGMALYQKIHHLELKYFEELFISYFYIQTNTNLYVPLDEETSAELAFSKREFQECIKHRLVEINEDLIQRVLHHLKGHFKQPLATLNLSKKNEYVFSLEDKYEIDIENGALYQGNKKVSPVPMYMNHSPLFKHFKLERESSCLMYPGDSIFECFSPAGVLRFSRNANGSFRVQKEFSFGDGKTYWYELYPLNPQQKKQLNLAQSCFKDVRRRTLNEAMTDGDMNAWSLCSDFIANATAPQFILTQNHRPLFYAPTTYSQFNSYETAQPLCNDPIQNRFDDPKFMICTKDHIFFKRYGLRLTRAPNQNYVLQDKPSFVYQPHARFPIPNVATIGFKEAYQKGAQTIERDYFFVPVQRFYRVSGTIIDNGEFFRFQHDASAVIATAQLTKIWNARHLTEADYPLWHYENTCRSILFPIINGEPKPEKAADALYLSYLYLAAGQPENAWNTLQKIQQRFSLDGSYEELTYLEWIVHALPVILDKTDEESVRNTPAYQACQLNALSLLTTFVMTGKRIEWPATNSIDETTANGEYELICVEKVKFFYEQLPALISEKLNHYLNVERHLVQPLYLNESMIRSLLAYYTRQTNDINGALGYRQRESTLATLIREKRLLEDNFKLLQNNPSKTAFIPLDLEATQKRLDEIKEEVALQKRVMKHSTVLEKRSIDLALPKENISINTHTLSITAREYYGIYSHAGWSLNIGEASSDAPHLAMRALSPDISEEEFFRFFPDYYKISADSTHKDHQKLIYFCRNYLIGHRHTPLRERCENIPLLVNLLYRRAYYTGTTYHSTISGIVSALRQQEHQLPKIEIYQARDVFKEPLAEVQSIFESLSAKIPTLEAPIPLPSKCRLIRRDEMLSEATLRDLKEPNYILTPTAFAYYYPLTNKMEVVSQEERLLKALHLYFNDSITALSAEDFDAIHRITHHVPTSLLAETLVDELQNSPFTGFYQQYRKSEAEFETQLRHQLGELNENPTFDQLEDAETKAGQLQHDHFDAKKQLAQIFSDAALRQSLQEKVTAMQAIWQTKVSRSLELLLRISAELPDSPEERQRIQIARSTLKQSTPTEKDLLNLYYRALPSAYRESMGLSEEKIQQLHKNIHEYAQEKLHFQHIVRIQKALAQTETTPTEEQFLVLASTLMSKNQVSGQEDSAIMRFQLEENMLLRPRQIEALRSLLSPTVKSPHQFDERIEKIIMGGGKSKVLLPLMAQKKATGLNLVVVEVPHPLLKTNHADLNTTSQKLFNQVAHVFQFDRDSDCSSGRLEEIYQQLLNIMTSKDYLITTGESVQSFRLKYLELLYSKPHEDSEYTLIEEWSAQVRSATKIVRLFKERSDAIIDEVHDGLLLKRKLNYAFGEPLPISPEVIQLNISLFVFLQSKLQFPKAVNGQDEQERIKNNEKALKSHWHSIKKDFPRMLIYSPESPLRSHVTALCQNNDSKKEALIRYLQEEETCDFLISCANKTILDAFAFFKAQQKILDVTLHKQYKENYGPSKIEELSEMKRSLAIPYAGNNKSKERSQFSSQLETMNYTIQSLRLTGISRTMLHETVQQWLTQARYEMLQMKGVSLVETKVAQAVTTHYLQRMGLRFEDLDIHDEVLMERLYSALHQDDRLIYDILENQILPQINQEQHILSSNPLNHADIYRSRQGISGTPSNYRTFHQRLKFNPKTSLGTDGFIQNLLISQRPPVSVVQFTYLRDFLRQVLTSNPSITAIMDICATFTGYAAYDVARTLAQGYSDRFEYILYFDGSDRLCAVSSKNPDALPIVLGTSEPDEITQRLGGCPLEKRFTYYDQLHTVGVDIKQAPNACGLALIDERTQLQAFLQGVMRMRGLETGQSIAVVAQHHLSNLDGYLAHMQENEALQLKDDIFLSALEKIDNLYHNNLMRHLSSCKDPIQQALLAEKFKDFFLQTQQLDLFKQYGSISHKMKTENVLKEYALDAFRRWEHLIREAQVEIEIAEKNDLLQEADSIVEETLPHCSDYIEWHEHNQEGQEYQNERENQKEQQQQKEEQREEEFFNPELKEKEKITWTRDSYLKFCSGSNYFESLGGYYSKNKMALEPLNNHLPGIDISSSLLISPNYRDVYQNQARVLSYYLKPVYAILFRLHEGKISACLITNQELQEITICQEAQPSDKVWIVNLKSTTLSGHLPSFLLEPKESLSPCHLPIYEQYHELMEQACFFAGEMRILSGREVPLTWITQSPDQKLAFFEKNLMAFRKTTPQDLIDIKALFSTANKGYEYIKLHAFDDLTVMNWRDRYPELSDRSIRSLRTLSEVFRHINENPYDPMPENAEDIYLAGHPTLPMMGLAYVEQHINLHRMIQMLNKMNQGEPSQILSPLAQKVLSIDYNALEIACADDSDLLQFRILMACISSPLFNEEISYKPCMTENALIKKFGLASPFSESDLLVKFLQKEELSLPALTQILEYPQSKKSAEIILKHPLISSLALSYEQFSSLLTNLSALDLELVFEAIYRMPLEPLMRARMKALALTQFKVTEGELVIIFIHDLSALEVWSKELILNLLKLEVNHSSWSSLWLERLLLMSDPSLIGSMLSHPSITSKEIEILASRLAIDSLPVLFDKCLSKLSLSGLVQLASRTTHYDLLDKLVDIKPLNEILAKTIWTNPSVNDDVRKKLLSKIASVDLFQQCLVLNPRLEGNTVTEALIANQALTAEDKHTLILQCRFSELNTRSIKKIVIFSNFSDETLLRVLNECSHLVSVEVFSEEFFKEKPNYQLTQHLFDTLCVRITSITNSFLPFFIHMSHDFDSQVIEKLKSLSPTQPQAGEIQKKLLSRLSQRVDFEALACWIPPRDEADYIRLLNISKLSSQDKDALIHTRSYQNITPDIFTHMPTQSHIQLKILSESNNSFVLKKALQTYQGMLTNNAWNHCLDSNHDEVLSLLLRHLTKENGISLLPRLLEKRQTEAWHSNVAQRAQQIGLVQQVISYPRLEISVRKTLLLSPSFSFKELGQTELHQHLQSVAYSPDVLLKIQRECSRSIIASLLKTSFPKEKMTDELFASLLSYSRNELQDDLVGALLEHITTENESIRLPVLAQKNKASDWTLIKLVEKATNPDVIRQCIPNPSTDVFEAMQHKWPTHFVPAPPPIPIAPVVVVQPEPVFSELSVDELRHWISENDYSSASLLKIIREHKLETVLSLFSTGDLNGKLTSEVVQSLLAKINTIDSPVLSWLIFSGELMRLQQLRPFIYKLKIFNAPQHPLWISLLQVLTSRDEASLVISSMNPKNEAVYLALLDKSRLSETDKIKLIRSRSYHNLDPGLVKEMLPYLARRREGLLKIVDELQDSFSDELFALLLSYAHDDLADGLSYALLRKVSLHNENKCLPLLASKNQTDAWRYRLVQQAQKPDVISQCIPNPSSIIQEAMKKKWPDYFRTQPTSTVSPIRPISPVAIDKFEEDIDNRPRPKPPIAQSPVNRSYGEQDMESHLPPPAPVVNTEIEHVVRTFVSHISNIKGKKFAPLVTRLNQLSAQYLRNELTLNLYKSQCKDALDQFKPQLSLSARRKLTIFEHIKEVLRMFFNVLDRLVSLFSSSTMANTYTPGAQRIVGRNHFFVKPNRETDLTRAIQAFEKKLVDFDNSGTSHSP